MNPTHLPLALTMGDACGIGPEILAQAFAAGAVPGAFVIGDLAVMRRAAALVAAREGVALPVALIEGPADARAVPPRCLPVL